MFFILIIICTFKAYTLQISDFFLHFALNNFSDTDLIYLITISYVVVYFSILYCRYQAGIVTEEMLSLPKTPFLAVGLLEALGAASGMAAGGMI